MDKTPAADPNDRLRERSFVGFVITQFLGAFNDNLYKQLMLLLAIPVAVAGAAAAEPEAAKGVDLQGIATVTFGIPFVIFGGFAGYLADRYSKRRIIVLCKVAEIVIMGMGVAAFYYAPVLGFAGLWLVLFLMGLQSTFFGPGKYGILPEMLPRSALPRANGIVLMTTFIAIIIGTAVAGPLKDSVVDPDLPRLEAAASLWIASLVCVGIAILGTFSSLLVRRVPVAEPELQLRAEYLTVPRPMRELLRRDRPLVKALVASCIFWLIAGLTLQSVNSLGKVQLLLSDTKTSLLVSLISVGIAGGAVLAGWMSRQSADNRVIQIGMWGTVLWCVLLAISIPGRGHLLGFGGSIPVLILLGAAAAFFAIPIQVFLQDRPPAELKGRMIAVMNQANFLAIVMAGILYQILDRVIAAADWPRSMLFAVMALLFLPVAIFFRLDSDEPAP
ncbi:MFS transporter [Candidatus Laterigemmans baculatus]|uniref:MFS transporter n=1 Tax=Candidatus Laterigemmans baculatus TaxID=2770505 RepID=UPI0013D985B4|nr:MFS transporter [Candidatus Laterigemmans baculatus]